MNILDIAKAVAPAAKPNIIGIRPGEKLHEQMIGIEDAPHTYEYEDHYKILPAIHNWSSDPSRINDGIKMNDGFTYTSDKNTEWMTVESLNGWIQKYRGNIGLI